MELRRIYSYPNNTTTFYSTSRRRSASMELNNLWITDNTGKAIQHLHYLPFGEDLVDQRNSSWNAPYTFSGKEKDVETGYGYFGARYYDSKLSVWLSVDPMSDKYPNMSPYNYCANNPVILVDPDGRDVYVFDQISGAFSHKIASEGPHQMAIRSINENGAEIYTIYQFNDPKIDALAIDNGVITHVQIMNDTQVSDIMKKSGIYNTKFPMIFALTEPTDRMDFGVRLFNEKVLSKNTFYIRGRIAYDISDLGNYLWGYAMGELGIPQGDAKLGAQINNMLFGRRNKTNVFNFGDGTYGSPGFWDSEADQRAITNGYQSSPGGQKNNEQQKKMNKEIMEKWEKDFKTSNSIY